MACTAGRKTVCSAGRKMACTARSGTTFSRVVCRVTRSANDSGARGCPHHWNGGITISARGSLLILYSVSYSVASESDVFDAAHAPLERAGFLKFYHDDHHRPVRQAFVCQMPGGPCLVSAIARSPCAYSYGFGGCSGSHSRT